jgi:tRNA pseudouridine32 synthase / 23S rRNA pseudouridine746 synthase
MARRPKSPLIPMRQGVAPSCVALPRLRHSPYPLLLDFLAERLGAIPRAEWAARLQSGQVLSETGQPLPPGTPYLHGERVYYWRALPHEPTVPFQETVLFQDEHLVVADKPHFLPVTPGGRFVRETLLVRLRERLNLPELSPLHRIDRETAGLVLFSVRAPDRDAYQRLFRERALHKRYEAVGQWHGSTAPPRMAAQEPATWERRSHLREDPLAFYRMQEAPSDSGLAPNSSTRIRLLERRGAQALFELEPVTGKRHQLRVHMAALGWPLVGDQFYPNVLRQPHELEDFRQPLQLLARELWFTDPVTGQARHFTSQRVLEWPGQAQG